MFSLRSYLKRVFPETRRAYSALNYMYMINKSYSVFS